MTAPLLCRGCLENGRATRLVPSRTHDAYACRTHGIVLLGVVLTKLLADPPAR